MLKSLLAGALLLALHSQARGAGILELLGDADVILLGEGTAAPSPRAGAVALHVRAAAVFKGSVAVGSTLEMVFPEWKGGVTSGLVPSVPPRPGSYGLWFLKLREGTEYGAIPLEGKEDFTHYHKPVGFYVPRSWIPPTGVSVERVLLQAVLERYWDDLANPRYSDSRRIPGERWLTQSLQYAYLYGAHDAALKVVEEMIKSGTAAERNLGALIGIRMSHDPAMGWLERNLEGIRSDQEMLADVLYALELHYKPNSSQGLVRIGNLILQNQKSQIAGLDLALAKSLGKVTEPPRGLPDKAMLPLAALLLDSPDPAASRRASHQFYKYAMTRIKDSFFNEGFRSHSGLSEKASAAENADFWRGWWADNQRSLKPQN